MFSTKDQAGARIARLGGGGEINFGGTRSLLECESNKKTENQKQRSSAQTFPQILTIFHQFLSENQQKKRSPSQNFLKSGVSPQKLRKNSSCSRILGR